MKFHFFTFGGSQFWEDVFFYQKWRIQRHYRSKKYRLLDNWDIERASGSFEDCRKAFVRFVEVYEIPRQTGNLIILLHGLGETKTVFRPLWKALVEKGYNVAAVNYPSTRKPMIHHIRQLEFFLTHCEDIHKVSFVTKGEGCLLLRMLLSNTYGWQDNFKVDKVININPINAGSDLFDLMARNSFLKFILGPMLKEGTPKKAKSISKLPDDINLGLLFCPTWLEKLCAPIVRRFHGTPIKSEITEESFGNQICHTDNRHLRIFNNPELITACLNFLEKGTFE